jgi:hypothetical protein
LKSGQLVGEQLRYVAEYAGEWLALLSWNAGSYHLAGRDRWIGWSDEQRRCRLPFVVNNSRFLIRPEVEVPNLASHLLGKCARRLVADWRNRYNYEPVLAETFVDCERFPGTCYRGANWLEIGTSSGRGRQDAEHRAAVSKKRIFALPLTDNWRDVLPMGRVVKEEKCKSQRSWAEVELGSAKLGDTRLSHRATILAEAFFDQPQASIPEACGSAGGAKAAYRFFDNESVTLGKLLKPHLIETERRMAEYDVILAVQDTTSLNYSTRSSMTGTGPISHNQPGSGGSTGLEVHDTLAFTSAGVPLGVLDAQCWARPIKKKKPVFREGCSKFI